MHQWYLDKVLGPDDAFKMLVRKGTIRLNKNGTLHSSNLSPNDNSDIRRFVRGLSRLLRERILREGIKYDALVSIPTGGDEYTRYLSAFEYEEKASIIPQMSLVREDGCPYPRLDPLGVPKGARILVVDDCIHTGGHFLCTESVLRAGGYEVAGLACIAELHCDSGSRGISVPIIPLFPDDPEKRKW